MQLRRVDSVDIPPTAKDPILVAPGPSQKKRKLQYEASLGASQNTPPSSSQPRSSQPSSSQSLRRISGAPLSQIRQTSEESEAEDIPEEESRDEVYVWLRTSIVGVQYYKGRFGSQRLYFRSADLSAAGLVGSGEEVMLEREPQNQYDR